MRAFDDVMVAPVTPPTWREEVDLPLVSPAVHRPGITVEGQSGSRVGAWSGPSAPVMRCLQVFDVECVTDFLSVLGMGGCVRREGW